MPCYSRIGKNHAFILHVIIGVYRVGQNRIYAPYMTVCLVISLPKIPYIHLIYMVLANPMYIRSF